MATPSVWNLWAGSAPYIFVTPREKKMELGQKLLKISLKNRSTLRGQFLGFAGGFALVYFFNRIYRQYNIPPPG